MWNVHCVATNQRQDETRKNKLQTALVFTVSGKCQTIVDFVISRPSQTFPTQGDNGRHLPCRVFKIPDGLGFSRHENQAISLQSILVILNSVISNSPLF